jgi:hypothetical protein
MRDGGIRIHHLGGQRCGLAFGQRRAAPSWDAVTLARNKSWKDSYELPVAPSNLATNIEPTLVAVLFRECGTA